MCVWLTVFIATTVQQYKIQITLISVSYTNCLLLNYMQGGDMFRLYSRHQVLSQEQIHIVFRYIWDPKCLHRRCSYYVW
jgi:hypothetical protein